MKRKLYQLSVHHHFDAAHYLPDHPGKCANLHGHRWQVEVGIAAALSTEELKENGGMVVDFGRIKKVIDMWDHSNLNDYLRNPTAEIITSELHDHLCGSLDLKENQVQVTVWESPECSVTVGGFDG